MTMVNFTASSISTAYGLPIHHRQSLDLAHQVTILADELKSPPPL
jgi:hypothetical protein